MRSEGSIGHSWEESELSEREGGGGRRGDEGRKDNGTVNHGPFEVVEKAGQRLAKGVTYKWSNIQSSRIVSFFFFFSFS